MAFYPHPVAGISCWAQRDNQTAKELTFEGATRGVFTYSLLETLRQYSNQLTYVELLNHLRIRLAQRVKEQSPQLEAIAGADPNLLFLSNTRTSGRPVYLVGYENSKGWHVNAGAFDGFKGGSAASPTELQLEADSRTLRVLDVYPGYSTVDGMPADAPPEGVHRALVTRWGSGGLKLAFTPDSDAGTKTMLSSLLERQTDGLFQLVDDPAQARYQIHTGDQSLSLLLPGEKYPLFQRIHGHEQANGSEFLQRVGMVARWVQMLELANPQTTLQDGEIKIELFRLTEPGKQADSDPAVPEDWRQAVSFRYFYQEGKWTLPAMQLKLTNTGTRTLWVSVLYMTSNFGMFNPLLPKQELGPGQEAWLLDVAHGVPHRSILLQMEQAYHSWGINQISDYLKVLVCTEEFSTDNFNQAGLPLDEREGGTRGFALWEDLSQTDWLTREIELRVVRPFDPVEVREIFTQMPTGFSGKAMRNTLPEATAAFPVAYAPQLEDGGEFAAAGDLCVLELWNCPDQPIDAANPLHFSSPEGVIPYRCDPQTGRFKVLAHSRENDTLVLQELPPESPSPYQGLPATRKIFFHQSL
ncbi:MAG: caspase family protein [Saprospirales bacterium]|nr:caspase family protein [Saprospirales bacterium]